jgi:hypothetical protein
MPKGKPDRKAVPLINRMLQHFACSYDKSNGSRRLWGVYRKKHAARCKQILRDARHNDRRVVVTMECMLLNWSTFADCVGTAAIVEQELRKLPPFEPEVYQRDVFTMEDEDWTIIQLINLAFDHAREVNHNQRRDPYRMARLYHAARGAVAPVPYHIRNDTLAVLTHDVFPVVYLLQPEDVLVAWTDCAEVAQIEYTWWSEMQEESHAEYEAQIAALAAQGLDGEGNPLEVAP